jgi:hypothetical protein
LTARLNRETLLIRGVVEADGEVTLVACDKHLLIVADSRARNAEKHVPHWAGGRLSGGADRWVLDGEVWVRVGEIAETRRRGVVDGNTEGSDLLPRVFRPT